MNSKKEQYITAGILFLDIYGYSKLDEIEFLHVHNKLMPDLYNLLNEENEEDNYLYKNTWGDGIILLNEDYVKLASVALKIRDYLNNNRYENIPVLKGKTLRARIALHRGEFMESCDPFQQRNCYVGLEIVRAARIEPITPVGCAFATEKMKDSITERHKRQRALGEFHFIPKGKVNLAKGFGTETIWEITHASDRDRDTHRETKTEYTDPENETDTAELKAKVAKISTLTNNGHHPKPLYFCYRENDIPCQFQTEALCLMAELLRSNEAKKETQRFALCLKEIREKLSHIYSLLDDPNVHTWKLTDSYSSISMALHEVNTFFSYLGRSYSATWPVKRKIKVFLERRTKTLRPFHNVDFLKGLDFLRKFCCENKKRSVLDEAEEFRTSNEVRYNISLVLKNSTPIENALSDLQEIRDKKTTEVIKEHLTDCASVDLLKCFCNICSLLPHIDKKLSQVPGIWSEAT